MEDEGRVSILEQGVPSLSFEISSGSLVAGNTLTVNTISPTTINAFTLGGTLTGGGGTTANGTTVKMTGVQFLTNATTTALVWTAEVVDDLGWHSNLVNPTRITVDAAGWYHVHSNATYVVNTTGTRFLAIFINGVGKRQNTRLAVSTLGTACEVSGLFYLAASDYVEIKGYQNSTGGLSVGGSNELLASFSVVSA